jgi:hypothetical protein
MWNWLFRKRRPPSTAGVRDNAEMPEDGEVMTHSYLAASSLPRETGIDSPVFDTFSVTTDTYTPNAPDASALSSDDASHPTHLRAVVDELKAEGFKGPFAISCDGMPVLAFHGPDVPLEPTWLEGCHSPLRTGATVMDLSSTTSRGQEEAGDRVLNCKAFCSNSLMFVIGEQGALVSRQLDLAQKSDGSAYAGQSPADAVRIPCLLGYPLPKGPPPDGAQSVAGCMEEVWDVLLFANSLYFVRSWTGTLRYRAHLLFKEGAMFINAIEGPADFVRADPVFPARQVDFLVKSLLYGVRAPAPVPKEVGPNTGSIAYYALTEYGKSAWYPSFGDTVAFRLWLNGAIGWFTPSSGQQETLEAIHAVEANDTESTRDALYAVLARTKLYQPLVFPDGVQTVSNVQGLPSSAQTRVEFIVASYDGRPCFRAYSDPTLRLEPGGYCEVSASALCRFVLEQREEAGLVLNAGGPYSCVLSRKELAVLADAD